MSRFSLFVLYILGGAVLGILAFVPYVSDARQPAMQAVKKQGRPRDVCHDGITYLQFDSGAVVPKIDRTGSLVVCL